MASAASVDTRRPRRALETRLIEKAWKDPEFRKDVVRDPKSMLEKHLGTKLPGDLKIFIHEEDSSTLHFSIPPTPAAMSELSDQELEHVAGGTDVAMAVVTVISAIIGTAVGAGETTRQGW